VDVLGLMGCLPFKIFKKKKHEPEAADHDEPPEPGSSHEPPPGRLDNTAMETGRGLALYDRELTMKKEHGTSFKDELGALGEHDTWVDMGAGEAAAMADHAKSHEGPLPNMIAVGHEKPVPARGDAYLSENHGDIYKYEAGDFGSMDDAKLGGAANVSLITDVLGIASYTQDLHGTLGRYANLLKPGGSAFIKIEKRAPGAARAIRDAQERGETPAPVITGERNQFFDAHGNKSGPGEWLSGAQGVHAKVADWQNAWHIHLTRGSGDVQLPPLKTTHYDFSHPPPKRIFQL
jgi:hypothetical protein